MSIQAVSICQRGGDVLLSRQYNELSSTRVHEILSLYPRLLQEGAQHTTLEEGGVRYIYEPLDELFVVLVSDLATSNILQDLKTLRLLTQLVKQTASPGSGTVSTTDVVNATFNILDAFDEVITLGFSENLTVSQVETFLRMESHEEKIQQIIERNKQLEAAEERKKKAKQLEAQRQAAAHSGHGLDANRLASRMGGSGMDAFSGMGGGMESNFGQPSSSGGFAGAASGMAGTGSNTSFESSYTAPSSLSGSGSALKGKGLKLGKKAAPVSASAGMPLLADPEPIGDTHIKPAARNITSSKSPTPAPASTTTDISVAEQLTIEMTRDGQVKTNRVSGTLNLFAGDREHAKLRIKTTTGGGASDYKPHPKMDRQLFASERILGLKNSQEELPASHVLLVKWTVDNVVVPITISCWVSEATDAGFLNVTLEYEVSSEFTGTLENIAVSARLPTPNAHVIDPTSNFEQFDDHIVWLIPRASASDESTGSFEFTAEADSESDFYPIDVTFSTEEERGPGSLSTFGKIDIDAVIDPKTGEELEFTKTASAQTASYTIR